MDILSLTSKTSVSVEALGRPVRSKAETPSPHASSVDPTDKAPPGSNAQETESQKEAPRTGLKTPETLLDLLTGATDNASETEATFLFSQNGLAEKLGEVKLPPTAESLLAALSNLGVAVPRAVLTDDSPNGVPAKLVQAIQQAPDLPRPVKVALVQLLHDAFVKPLPASSLIGLGRPVASTAPAGTPAVFQSNDPSPHPAPSNAPDATLIESNAPPVKVVGQALDATIVQELNVTSVFVSGNASDDEAWPAGGNTPSPRLESPDPVAPKPHEGPLPRVVPIGSNLGMPDPILEAPRSTMGPSSNLLSGDSGLQYPVSTDDEALPAGGNAPSPRLESPNPVAPKPHEGPLPRVVPIGSNLGMPEPILEVPRPTMGPSSNLLSGETGLQYPVSSVAGNDAVAPLPRQTGNEDDATVSVPAPTMGPGRTHEGPKPGENVVPVRDNGHGLTQTMEPKPSNSGAKTRSSDATVQPLPHGESDVTPGVVPIRTMTVTNGNLLDAVDAEFTDNTIDTDFAVSDGSVPELAGRQLTTVPNPVNRSGKDVPVASMNKVAVEIADRIETLVLGKKHGSVTIHLRPDELGSVTLTVRSFGNRVDATVQASNDDVRAALHAHRHDLVQNVESRGLSLSSFHVGQDAQGSNAHQGQRTMQNEADRNAQLRLGASNRPVLTVSPASYGHNGSAGVDYLV